MDVLLKSRGNEITKAVFVGAGIEHPAKTKSRVEQRLEQVGIHVEILRGSSKQSYILP
jgi:hypothetical protein